MLYIGLSKFLDGYKSGTVATEVAGRGKGLAQKAYLNVSDILGVPIYSDTTQTDASRLGIWDKLIQQYPERIVGYDQKTNKNLPLSMTDKGPVVNQNQPIYVDRNKKDTTKPIAPNQRYRTRVLKLLPIKQGVAEGKQPGKSVTDAIQKVLPIAQEIWFHGSRATGKHRRNSDTDILVVIPDDIVGTQYLAVVRILQKLSSDFVNYDIQPTKTGNGIYRVAQEEGQLLWSNKQNVVESWSEKYKHSINCSNPKGFSQRAHCAGEKK